jgi:hypothetical protein
MHLQRLSLHLAKTLQRREGPQHECEGGWESEWLVERNRKQVLADVLRSSMYIS